MLFSSFTILYDMQDE